MEPVGEMIYELLGSLNLCENDNVLFMYCGKGDLPRFLATIVNKGKVIAIDPDQENIEYCRKKFADIKNLEFHVDDIVDGQHEECYDVVFSKNAFSSFKTESKDEFLEKVYKCLKPGGRLSILAETNLKEVDPAIIPKDRTNEYLNRTATEISSNVACFTEYDEFFSALTSSNLEMNAEIVEWIGSYKKICEAREILNLEFRQLVRIHTTKNDE